MDLHSEERSDDTCTSSKRQVPVRISGFAFQPDKTETLICQEVELSRPTQARVECVTQAVANEVEGGNGEQDGQPRE